MTQTDHTVAKLQSLYNTTDIFYLSTFYQPNGDKVLYDFLRSVRKDTYDDNFRILIVQDCVDVYNYQDLPGLALTTLQKYVSEIDISNFFILIVTPNKNIDFELEQVQNLHSTDSCIMQSVVVDGDYTVVYKKQDTFCMLPWMHLYIGPNGNVLPCCHADVAHPMGSIEEQPIDSIIKSSKFNQLRLNLLTGQRSKECSRCYALEDSGLPSPRTDHNAKWSDVQILNPTGQLDSFKPRYLDIRLNNICNLKCRMCSGYFSSAIAQEEVELFGNKKSVESSMRSKQRQLALSEIIKYLPSCEKIYFAGGEPLLSSEHYDILNELILCGNTNLEIVYNTNFTTLTYKNYSVLELWNKFSNITVGASLDAQGKVAEYVRHGTDWDVIERNLKTVNTHCPHVRVNVTSTVGLLNAESLIDLQKTWHNENKLNILHFSQTVLIGPVHLSVSALPQEHKMNLEKLITDHINWCNKNGAQSLAMQWNDVLVYMWSRDDSHAMTEFKRLTHAMDQHRHESLSTVLPKLKNLL